MSFISLFVFLIFLRFFLGMSGIFEMILVLVFFSMKMFLLLIILLIFVIILVCFMVECVFFLFIFVRRCMLFLVEIVLKGVFFIFIRFRLSFLSFLKILCLSGVLGLMLRLVLILVFRMFIGFVRVLLNIFLSWMVILSEIVCLLCL